MNGMISKQLSIVLVCLLLLSMSLMVNDPTPLTFAQEEPDLYVGVDMGFGSRRNGPAAAKILIDQVSNFTNLFIVGTTGITDNSTVLNEVLQYAFEKDLSFISFLPTKFGNLSGTQWLQSAQQTWGSNLLGFLCPVEDEPGGQVLDRSHSGSVYLTNNLSDFPTGGNYNYTNHYVTNYIEAASKFEYLLSSELNAYKTGILNSTKLPLFTSDYALYWFDYKGGYDTVFAEFGWNYSRQLNVALCRGAAQVLDKDWGVVITYTYTTPPYLGSGAQLYEDMVLAYDSGAKYIIVFNTAPDYLTGILQQEHFDAMQKFWLYAKSHPRNTNDVADRTAYVLPYGYAYGFRGPEDKIWGLWEADSFSFNQSVIVSNLLQKYEDKLDIIYDDALKSDAIVGYRSLLYWNDSSLLPSPMPSPWPPATPTPSPSPSPTIEPTPSTSPAPSPSPSPIQTPSPEPTYTPVSTPLPSSTEVVVTPSPSPYLYSLLDDYIFATAAVAGALFVGAFVVLKKRQN